MKKHALGAFLALYIVLGCWKDHIAIFRDGSPEPYQIFPNKVSSLPPADQEALEKGIVVRNHRDLQQLLEDYLS